MGNLDPRNLDPSVAARISDAIEAQAFASMYAAAPRELAQRLGLAVQQYGGVTALVAAHVPSTMFNRALGLGLELGLDTAATDADLTRLLELYRAAGVSSWWLHWNPYAQPQDFERHIAARGFTQPRRRAWAKFLRGPQPAPAVITELSVRGPAPAEVAATANAITAAFEMPAFMVDWIAALAVHPAWRLYCVADGRQIVGGGCLFVAGTRAWFGLGAVLPSHRKRGGQRALLAQRMADAIALGCTELVTETGEPIADEPNPSLANILRSGFVRVAVRQNYAAPA